MLNSTAQAPLMIAPRVWGRTGKPGLGAIRHGTDPVSPLVEQVETMFASSNKCIASSNKCLTSSNNKLLVTRISY